MRLLFLWEFLDDPGWKHEWTTFQNTWQRRIRAEKYWSGRYTLVLFLAIIIIDQPHCKLHKLFM